MSSSFDLNQLIAAVYQAASGLVPLSRALELLARLTNSDRVLAAHFNVRQRTDTVISSFNFEPDAIEQYSRLAPQNPWFTSSSFYQAEGLVWRGGEIIDDAQLKLTDFYRSFMLPQAIAQSMHLVLRVQGPEILHVLLARSAGELFDSAALEVGRIYALHAREALVVQNVLESARWMERGFDEASSVLSVGMAIIEAPATVRYLSDACRAIFDEAMNGIDKANGYAISGAKGNGGIRAPVQVRLPRAVVDALTQVPVPNSCVLHGGHRRNGRPIIVHIHPYNIASNVRGERVPGFILTCRDGGAVLEVDRLALREAFNLTAAEARICAALAAGDSVGSLARKLGISPLTARTHLKHIFEKTSTTRQSELMRLLVSMSRPQSSPTATPPAARGEATVVHFRRDVR